MQRDAVETQDAMVANLSASRDPHHEPAVATVDSNNSQGANEPKRPELDIRWQAPRQLRGFMVAGFCWGMFAMMNAAPMLPPSMQNPPAHLYWLMAFGSVVCVLLLAVPPFQRMYHAGRLDNDGNILFCKQPWALRSRFRSLKDQMVIGLPDFSKDVLFRHKSWYIQLSEIERYSVSFGQQSNLWHHLRPARIDIVRKGFEHPTRTVLVGTGEDAERICKWLDQQIEWLDQRSAARADDATTSGP